MLPDILKQVRQAARKKILFLPHAVTQMSRPDRMITPAEVKKAITSALLLEDYPKDPRGHSCLILGFGTGRRSLHIVCSPKEDFLAIITAYLPSEEEWEDNWKRRKRK